MGVKGKNIPKHHRLADAIKNLPDNSGGSFGNSWSVSGTFELNSSHQSRGLGKMYLVGQRHAGPATAAVTKITRDPDCFHPDIECGGQHAFEIGTTASCSITAVMQLAAIPPGIEN